MKICWDNLENLIYTKNGNFRDVKLHKTFFYIESCSNCGEPFLGKKGSKYCCYSCSMVNRWNDKSSTMNSDDFKNKISNSVKELWKNDCSYKKNVVKGIKERWKDKDSSYNSDEYRRLLSEKRKGSNNGSYNGGYFKNGKAYYDTYAPQISWCEEVRRDPSDPNILNVRCKYCGKWYAPSPECVNNRIGSLNGYQTADNHFYCSYGCKKACPIFGKSAETLMKEDAIRAGRMEWLELNREVQPELRRVVMERDGYQCTKCGSTEELHCHHILPVATDPLVSADIDNCIILCKSCHMEVHRKDGCRYGDLRMCLEE